MTPPEAGKVPGRVTFRSQLPPVYELKDLLTDPSHPDAYFQSFEDRLQNELVFETLGEMLVSADQVILLGIPSPCRIIKSSPSSLSASEVNHV
jgi:hypothetical protein